VYKKGGLLLFKAAHEPQNVAIWFIRPSVLASVGICVGAKVRLSSAISRRIYSTVSHAPRALGMLQSKRNAKRLKVQTTSLPAD